MEKSQSYDFLVAGAGSAGCTLAARLAEDPDVSVCLVESGGKGRHPFITMPAGNGFLFGNPKYDWGFESIPQEGLNGRRIYYPRGKGLGGSSNLNGMIYLRGNAKDYDRWLEMGLDGWGYADVLPYFKQSESAPHRDERYHGHSGPLKVSLNVNFEKISQLFVEAAQQAGAPYNSDFNGQSQVGIGRFDTCVLEGKRQTSAAVHLAKRRPNLTVRTDTHVVGISLKNGRAVGLRVVTGNGTLDLHAKVEVISCLGAFGSPQLLMLSGIGPADHLRQVGIEPVVDLPGVGESLQDHPSMPLKFDLVDPSLSFARFQRIDKAIGLGLQYFLTHDGPGAGSFWSTALFHSLRNRGLPEIETYCTPMVVREESGTSSWSLENLLRLGRTVLARGKTAVPGVQFDMILLCPQSRGRVRLASSDPKAPPLIDPAYLRAPRDLEDLVAGVAHIRKVAAQPAFEGVLGKELCPGENIKTDEEIEECVRAELTTGHHPVSSCRMGSDDDPESVLHADFRVRGMDGLRVVDASAFPDQINGNPNATIMMMAERAADMVLGKPFLEPEVL